MKTLKHHHALIAAIITLICLPSCQSEDEMEDLILEGYEWEGQLPIWNDFGDDYYSVYTFEKSNNHYRPGNVGTEVLIVNGRLQGTYGFKWYWDETSHGVLVLDFSSHWHNEASCIAAVKVKNGVLTGTFYEDYRDYKEHNTAAGHFIRLEANY